MGKILIVDNLPKHWFVLERFLGQAGYRFQVAVNGRQVLERVPNVWKPDLILLAVEMPDLDGYQICRRLRATRATTGLPIVLTGESPEILDKLAAFEAGGDDYLTKPFDRHIVLACIQKYVHPPLREWQWRLGGAWRARRCERLLTAHMADNHPPVQRAGRDRRIEMCYANVRIDPAKRQAWIDGLPVDLSATEFIVLRELVQAREAAVSKHALLVACGAASAETVTRTVARLRSKGANIQLMWGIAYKLCP